MGAIQVVSNEEEIKVSDKRHIHVHKKRTIYKGFSIIARHIIEIFSIILSVKLDGMDSQNRENEIKDEIMHTIRLAGEISTKRSLPELAQSIKKLLPKYFDFEAVGVLFRDQKSESMFTVNEIAVEEDPEELLKESLQGEFHARNKLLHGKPGK